MAFSLFEQKCCVYWRMGKGINGLIKILIIIEIIVFVQASPCLTLGHYLFLFASTLQMQLWGFIMFLWQLFKQLHNYYILMYERFSIIS